MNPRLKACYNLQILFPPLFFTYVLSKNRLIQLIVKVKPFCRSDLQDRLESREEEEKKACFSFGFKEKRKKKREKKKAGPGERVKRINSLHVVFLLESEQKAPPTASSSQPALARNCVVVNIARRRKRKINCCCFCRELEKCLLDTD